MLVLTLKRGDRLLVGDSVEILIKRVWGDDVKFVIDAPREVKLRRIGRSEVRAAGLAPGGRRGPEVIARRGAVPSARR